MYCKCDYTILDHEGNRVEFSGCWVPIEQLDILMSYMSSLVGYGTKFESIRFYFGDER